MNFFSLIVYWFVTVIYQPLLYGVQISEDIFALLCPVIKMAGNTELLEFKWGVPVQELSHSSMLQQGEWFYRGPGEGWGYIGICAGIGVALMVAALLLYRRRNLETAGEFIAIKVLKPVFAVVFSLVAGGAVAAFGQATGLADGYLLFLVIGLVVGWLGGQMLLHRTVRVFTGRTFAHLAILGLALVLTVGLTAWDPVGITRYIPENDRIQTVEFTQGGFWGYSNTDLEVSDPENIEQLRQIHQQLLNERDRYSGSYRTHSIRYTLKSGRQVTRTYKVYTGSDAWGKIQDLYNQPEVLLGEKDWNEWYKSVNQVYFNGDEVERYAMKFNALDQAAKDKVSAYTMKNDLLRAIWLDGNAGRLHNSQYADKYDGHWVSLERLTGDGYREWKDYYIPASAENCQQWIKKYEAVLKVFEMQ